MSESLRMEDIGDMETDRKEDYFEIDIPYSVFQTLRDGNYDANHICRICLCNDNDVLYPILSVSEDSLSHMFTAVTLLQPQLEDGLPQNICGVCQEQVAHCYEFKVKCERADYILKSVLTGQFVASDRIHRVIKDEENNVNEIKNEDETIEDVQYLEDIYAKEEDINLNKHNKRKRKKPNYVTESCDEVNKTTKGKTKFQCSLCRKVFRKEQTLHSHIEAKHTQDVRRLPHPCTQCKLSFESEHDLLIHSSIHIISGDLENGAWRCSICPKEFKSKLLLKRHLERHMQSKRHSCPQCDKTFTERYAMLRHARVHTGEHVEKKYQCHLCEKRFGQSGQLSVHVRRHSGVTSCACPCGKRFASARLLASHRRVHSDLKLYECRHCHQRFRHESTRTTHERTHTGERPYVCSVCGKRFIQNSNLTLHMRTHTGERPYSCTTCGRNFSSGSSLKAHERVHTGERPYSCDVCGKRFARGSLSVHMRTHTGERPFRCGACARSFSTRARLRLHCRVHTGEKPYECATCSKTFISKTHLIKHIKKHAIKKVPQRCVQPANHSETSTNVIGTKAKKQDYQCYFVESLDLPKAEKPVAILNSPVALKIPLEKTIKNTELIIVNGLQEGVNPANVIIELHSK